MRQAVTVSLPKELKVQLDRMSKREHLNRSDVVREALQQYLVRQDFHTLRRGFMLDAQKRGIFTDEDVFRVVS